MDCLNVYRLKFCVEFSDNPDVLFVEYYAVNKDILLAMESTREILAKAFPSGLIYPIEEDCALLEKV